MQLLLVKPSPTGQPEQWREVMRAQRKHVEVFTAGCPFCEPMVELVLREARHCEVTIHNIKVDERSKERAKALGVVKVPSVVVDGTKLPGDARGYVTETALRAAGVD